MSKKKKFRSFEGKPSGSSLVQRIPIKLAVCVPSQLTVSSKFMTSVLDFQAACLMNMNIGDKWVLDQWYYVNQRGSILPLLRQALVDKAKLLGCTHMLFVDSDMMFPKDILHKWIPLRKEVIAANCVTKSIPAVPTARRKEGDPLGSVINTSREDAQFIFAEQVWRIGTGVMLIDMKVFDKIKKPYFPVTYTEAHDRFVGEDWNFCAALEEAGIPIFIEHSVSWHVKHLGEYEYGMDMVEMQEYAKSVAKEAQQHSEKGK